MILKRKFKIASELSSNEVKQMWIKHPSSFLFITIPIKTEIIHEVD